MPTIRAAIGRHSFNAQAFFDPSELSVAKPEGVDAFELGAKTQFADRRITLNMAGFYYKYKNQQFINVDPGTAAQTLLNIPSSRIMGGEAELTARASDTLTIRAGLGILDTKIEKGIVSGIMCQGNSLSNAPSVTFSGGFDATVMDGDSGKLSLHGDLSYSASQYFEVLNVSRLKQKSYALLSGILTGKAPMAVSMLRSGARIWPTNSTSRRGLTCLPGSGSITTMSARPGRTALRWA
jgi:iron complex outermembrane receptor protein